jgi:DNA-binding transcriptional regulator YhcF (GntR family)
VRALASELRINFNTVSRSYRLLDEAGIISTQQGRGTYILEMPPPEIAERLRLESLDALTRHYLGQAKRLGFSLEQVTAHLQLSSNALEDETENID